MERANRSASILLPSSPISAKIGPTFGTTYSKTYTAPSISLKGYDLQVGDQICAQFTVAPGYGSIDDETDPGSNSNIDSGYGSVSSEPIPSNAISTPPMCSTIVNEPYARFYGNDVVSGAQFSNSNLSCDPKAAGIIGMSSGGVQATGSGSQFAAMSLGQISSFATAFLRHASPTSTSGLMFANTPTSGLFNSSTSGCQEIFNYYGLKPAGIQTIDVSGLPNTAYDINAYASPSLQLLKNISSYVTLGNNGTATRVTGRHGIYVDGNVYIPSNITYDNGQYNAQTNTFTKVPSLYVIAKGNIYIGPNVPKILSCLKLLMLWRWAISKN